MKDNPIKRLGAKGQSIWLDYIQRDLLLSGELLRLIEEDGLRGMTSNPAIFNKAIGGSDHYDDNIRSMVRDGKSYIAIYEALSQNDVQGAADIFRPVYTLTHGYDGYVSLEVNPHLAHDTKGTIDEARRLWSALDRQNVLIKVPATTEGLQAIQQLISEGISVNVTLLFGLPRYRQVAEAYISGLEARLAAGKSIDHIASVASFFVSRIDSLLDPMLGKLVDSGGEDSSLAKQMQGQIAIASAKGAYQIYKEIFTTDRFQKLSDQGARPQRLLWASTGTKNPNFSDVKYIEALIGPDTVNTIPVDTLNAYRIHGKPETRLEQDTEESVNLLKQLPELGLKIETLTQQLEDEGVEKFQTSFDALINTLSEKWGLK